MSKTRPLTLPGIPVRRKSWIFLVDLRETHELRERLNDPRVPLSDMLDEVAKFNAPVIAATSEPFSSTCPLLH